jgi:hypothetical protein
LVSDLFEPTPSPYLNPGMCDKCHLILDSVVNKTVLDSPPQLIIFEINVTSSSSKPAQPKDMVIDQAILLTFSQTMATYRLKGFVTYKQKHYQNYFVVDGLEDFFLFYSNLNSPNPTLVERVPKYTIVVAIYGLQREGDVYDDDEVLEFDEVTERLRQKCLQDINDKLHALTTPKKKSRSKKKLDQLNIMLQKTNKKTKYFLPLIEHFLFPDSNTRKYILESEGGGGEVGDNSTENISNEEGENEDDNERDEEEETEDI